MLALSAGARWHRRRPRRRKPPKESKLDKTNSTQERFERVDPKLSVGTALLHGPEDRGDAYIGGFLSRLWALFGPPDLIQFGGFDYTLRDKETGLVFTAYSGKIGPAYGGFSRDTQKVVPVIEAFDKILAAIQPIDCEIQFDTEFGPIRAGARGGVPFDVYPPDAVAE